MHQLPWHDSLTFSSAPSGPPQNVVARATNSSTLIISWAPPVAERLNGLIQRYQISITGLETRTSEQFSTTEESIVIANRHPYYRYSYMVAAVTTGQGPYSTATLVRMPEAGKCTLAWHLVSSMLDFLSLQLQLLRPHVLK